MNQVKTKSSKFLLEIEENTFKRLVNENAMKPIALF